MLEILERNLDRKYQLLLLAKICTFNSTMLTMCLSCNKYIKELSFVSQCAHL